jgi:pimeloyl-ACP methyl ester carboxylesterase
MSYLLKANAVSRTQVIAAIYETMIRPQLSDRFLAPGAGVAPQESTPVPDGGLDLGVRGDVALALREDPDLQMHFARAADILEQQWVKAGRPDPLDFGTRGGGVWVLIAPGGRIAAVSQDAAEALDGPAPAIEDLNLLPDALARLQRKAGKLSAGSAQGVAPAVLQTADPGRRFLCRSVADADGRQAGRWLMAEALDFHWDSDAEALVAATFGLSDQEAGLVRGLMWGETLPEIAGGTGIPLARLTEQLQQIMAKAGAPGQAEFLRLLAYLIAEAQNDRMIRRGERMPEPEMLCAPGLPQMQFYRFGAETGQPVIFLHSMMDGLGAAQWLQPQFRQRGFRVYAPMRAGFGGSEPPDTPEQAFDVLTDQLEALISRENLRRPILLGHRMGGSFAHVAARRLRDKLGGVLIAGGVAPVDNLARRYPLQGQQRLFRLIARRSPFLLRYAVKWWIRPYLLKDGNGKMERSLIAGGGDAGIWEDLRLAPLFASGRQHLLEKDTGGMISDFYWLVHDWSGLIGGNTAPVIYLHGDQDPVTPVAYLQGAMAGRRNVQIRQCRGTGALLLFARPELVFAALEELSDR